jgi:hypothetical protein
VAVVGAAGRSLNFYQLYKVSSYLSPSISDVNINVPLATPNDISISRKWFHELGRVPALTYEFAHGTYEYAYGQAPESGEARRGAIDPHKVH